MKIHSSLGPGLLESTYEACLFYELNLLGYKVLRQLELPLVYNEVRLDAGYRIDLLVDDELIIELKSVEALTPLHEAQILTYMKLANKKLGLLINFNVKLLKEGIRRFVL